MTIAISHKGLGHLLKAIGSSDVEIKLKKAEAQAFINLTGDYIYALIRGPIDREIVRIDISSSSSRNGKLAIARGQGGSTASSWPRGTLIMATTNADHYNSIIQRGIHRQIAYNPNEILTPLYAGEKVYQTAPAGCERWWKAFNAVNPYWDIFTGEPCLTEEYQDIGWDYELLLAVAPPELIATTGYIYGLNSNVNTARQVGIAQSTSTNDIMAAWFQLGDWNIGRSLLVWDLSGESGLVSSATIRMWTSGNTIDWGDQGGVSLVEGKTGWKGEGGGGGNLADNYTTWFWPGPGLETWWGTTKMAPSLNKGTGSASHVLCEWVLNAAGLAVLNSKIGTSNWFELMVLSEMDVNNVFTDNVIVYFYNERYGNPAEHPSLTLTFA